MWSFRKVGSKWSLVFFKDEAIYPDQPAAEPAYIPGYESSKLRDILEAIWYLNGSPYCHLPERTRKLLDTFRF